MTESPIVLFDGVCNLCTGSVQFILRHDQKQVFRFASLQSGAGRSLCHRHNIAADNFETMVLIVGDTAFTRSEAALRIASEFGGIWRLGRVCRLIPRGLRDAVYDVVARHRYRWFGKTTECWLPTPDLKARFLDQDQTNAGLRRELDAVDRTTHPQTGAGGA